MGIALSSLRDKVRYLTEDLSESGSDIYTYENSSVFTLSEENATAINGVYKNDVEIGSSDYSYDSTNQKVTITASLTSGDSVEIKYAYYPKYSNTEIDNYVQAALSHISVCRYYTWEVVDSTIYPDPSKEEQNLIAVVAGILMEPDNKTYRLPDMSIVTPKDLPTIDKIRRAIKIFKKSGLHGKIDVI